MRYNMNKNKIFTYLTITLTSISFYFAIQNFNVISGTFSKISSILNPFLIGLAMAYLFWRPLKFIECLLDRYLFRGKVEKSHTRIFSVVILYLIVGIVIFSVFSFVLPQIIQSLTLLSENLPSYFKSVESSLNALLQSNGVEGDVYQLVNEFIGDVSGMMMQMTTRLIPMLIDFSVGLTSTILNTFLVIVVSIYCLIDKESFFARNRKLMYALLPEKMITKVSHVLAIFDDTFGRYFIGQLTDAVVVGSICFAMMLVFKFPFALLISVIVMCTNVIPYVGPFIGAVPGTFIILITGGPMQALWFILMIFVLQQIDGNILVPKIIGDSIGISGFWVLFAIMVGGGLFGFLGVLLGVPTLSVIFKLLKVFSEKRLKKKELPIETQAYLEAGRPTE